LQSGQDWRGLIVGTLFLGGMTNRLPSTTAQLEELEKEFRPIFEGIRQSQEHTIEEGKNLNQQAVDQLKANGDGFCQQRDEFVSMITSNGLE
jgi:Sec-independent protein translocase protein TatA